MDRDEPRFAQASKQMLETGDFVAIRFQDEARNKKPVGIYWMQAAVVSAAERLGVPEARTRIWLYRIPSLAGAIATVLLTYWAALALGTPGMAFLAGLLMASTILLGVEARLAKTDAVTAATVVAAMGVLARVWMRHAPSRDWRLPAIFWTAIGVGLLVKGPITPMVPLFAAIALSLSIRGAGWLKALRPVAGLVWCLLMVLPWFALIMAATKGAFLSDSLGSDMLGKVASGQEAHGAPPGTYLAAFIATAWPMAPFTLMAAPFVWRERRDPAVSFLLAWLVPAWFLFELVPTKLPHYVLPLFPAIAILTALAVEQGAISLRKRFAFAVAWLVPAIPAILIAVALGGAVHFGVRPGWLFLVFAAVLLVQAWRMCVALLARDRDGLLSGSIVLAVLTYATVWPGVLGGRLFEPFALSPRLAEARQRALGSAPNCSQLQVATTQYREPSLVFLVGTDLVMTTGDGAAAFLKRGSCRLAFVTGRDEASFQQTVGGAGDIQLLERVAGVNLNGGRPLDIGVYLRQGDAR
jgi:4-amino-4-deoxy-L-arabinose transferase-like glycosyltransferase